MTLLRIFASLLNVLSLKRSCKTPNLSEFVSMVLPLLSERDYYLPSGWQRVCKTECLLFCVFGGNNPTEDKGAPLMMS